AVLAVDRDRITDSVLLNRPADVVDVPLERKLGRVDADDDQTLIRVLLRPRADVAEGAQPVDARVRPEVDQDDLAAQPFGCERLPVEPARRAVEGRQAALDVRRVQAVEQAHSTTTRNGLPVSTTYVASSAAFPSPTFLTECTVSAGTIKASPALYVFAG